MEIKALRQPRRATSRHADYKKYVIDFSYFLKTRHLCRTRNERIVCRAAHQLLPFYHKTFRPYAPICDFNRNRQNSIPRVP